MSATMRKLIIRIYTYYLSSIYLCYFKMRKYAVDTTDWLISIYPVLLVLGHISYYTDCPSLFVRSAKCFQFYPNNILN